MLEPVAEALGNTPAISRKSYVHPALIEAVKDGERRTLGLQCPRADEISVERRARADRLPRQGRPKESQETPTMNRSNSLDAQAGRAVGATPPPGSPATACKSSLGARGRRRHRRSLLLGDPLARLPAARAQPSRRPALADRSSPGCWRGPASSSSSWPRPSWSPSMRATPPVAAATSSTSCSSSPPPSRPRSGRAS